MSINDDNRLGNNIRSLRNAYGDTQQDLAKAVGVSRNSISYYENKGRRDPEIISAIAKRYMVSVYELQYCDFTGLKEITYDNEDFFKKFDIIFPIISSEKAFKDVDFKKAYHLHIKIYSEIKANNQEAIADLLDCLDLYKHVFYNNIDFTEDKRIIINNRDVIGAVGLNTIAILSVFLCIEQSLMLFNENSLLSRKIKFQNLEILKICLENDFTYNEAKEEIKELNEELDCIEWIKILKKIVSGIGNWRDLLYYHCALEYIFNLIENEYDPNVNKMIGIEMMQSFSSCQNVYAMRYLKYI